MLLHQYAPAIDKETYEAWFRFAKKFVAIECCDDDGHTIWLADFAKQELELVERPAGTKQAMVDAEEREAYGVTKP